MPPSSQLKKTTRSSKNRSVPIRIELQHVRPLVWRRIVVPGSWSLGRLHSYLQWVMGWQDRHIHKFRIGKLLIADPRWIAEFEEIDPAGMLNERKISISEVVERTDESREMQYLYDMSDGWTHRLVFERDEPAAYIDSLMLPLCVGGENACPPEDVGGPPGYVEFLAAITKAAHPEHVSMLQWVGGAFDPKGFDLNRINCDWHQRQAKR